MEMTTKAPEGIEQLLPAFHGQSAQILAYVAARGTATPEEIRKDLGIPRSTIYKLLSQLVTTGLVMREKAGKVESVRVPDFLLTIGNTTLVREWRITSRNVLAFDSAHTPAGRMFIERHGPEKFAKFVELYDGYERGATTSQLMARELGVTRYEIELLLSDIRSIAPVVLEIGRRQSRR
jgi:DNA-binding transcriptional ArsR family regulator